MGVNNTELLQLMSESPEVGLDDIGDALALCAQRPLTMVETDDLFTRLEALQEGQESVTFSLGDSFNEILSGLDGMAGDGVHIPEGVRQALANMSQTLRNASPRPFGATGAYVRVKVE